MREYNGLNASLGVQYHPVPLPCGAARAPDSGDLPGRPKPGVMAAAISMSVLCDSDAEIERLYAALTEGEPP